ncbi:MAG: response regulator [Candidatus Aminicenantes bacterium]|nr:response regulator [Candidatus Aminicenantes bacterium]
MIKILVIDDDKLIRWSLKEIFTQEGHSVDTAATADAALSLSKISTYQLILADLDIDNVSGIEMLKRIQQSLPETQIIILSAQSRQHVESQIDDLSIASILEKPFTAQEIRDATKKVLAYANIRNESTKNSEEV